MIFLERRDGYYFKYDSITYILNNMTSGASQINAITEITSLVLVVALYYYRKQKQDFFN